MKRILSLDHFVFKVLASLSYFFLRKYVNFMPKNVNVGLKLGSYFVYLDPLLFEYTSSIFYCRFEWQRCPSPCNLAGVQI